MNNIKRYINIHFIIILLLLFLQLLYKFIFPLTIIIALNFLFILESNTKYIQIGYSKKALTKSFTYFTLLFIILLSILPTTFMYLGYIPHFFDVSTLNFNILRFIFIYIQMYCLNTLFIFLFIMSFMNMQNKLGPILLLLFFIVIGMLSFVIENLLPISINIFIILPILFVLSIFIVYEFIKLNNKRDLTN